MLRFECSLIVTHVIFANKRILVPLDGPYNAVNKVLSNIAPSVDLYMRAMPKSNILGLNYLVDFIFIAVCCLKYFLRNLGKRRLVVGIDPLSCLPLTLLKKPLGFFLVYYCVDFNKSRFKNNWLQYLYEKADEICSRLADQTWVVSEALQTYKKIHFKVDSHYIPNSTVFNSEYSKTSKKHSQKIRIVWGGSFLTESQYDIFFSLLKKIQNLNSRFEFVLAPTTNHRQFEIYSKKYSIKKIKIVRVMGRDNWRKLITSCDAGLAIYDDNFGSTKFIEPLKIWDYLICGVPFIISEEASLSTSIRNSGVVYILEPRNQIAQDNTLEQFLRSEKLRKLRPICFNLARQFDIQKKIKAALEKIML